MKVIYRNFFIGVVLAVGVLQVSCAPLIVQSPNSKLRPVNATRTDMDDRLFVQGYDVVSYFTKGISEKGAPEYKADHEQVTFYFVSDENRKLFQQNPEAYIPQFGGYCSNGIAYGIPWGGDGDTFQIVEGKLYLFGGLGSKEAFELSPDENRKLAHEYWDKEVKGSNAFFQRLKRLIFRVPHYKTGEELAAAVEKKKSSIQAN